MYLHKNIHCDPLKELSHQDGSNIKGLLHMFLMLMKNKKNYL